MAERPVQSTSGEPIRSAPPDRIMIYAPDGTPHTVAPVDAREILASGSGYTVTPPAEVALEQQPIEQPVDGDAPAAGEAVAETDAGAGSRRASRSKNGK